MTIRNIEDSVKARLRLRAAAHGRSMEDEVRHILRDALDCERPPSLADIALEIFGPTDGVELESHHPTSLPEAIDFGPE